MFTRFKKNYKTIFLDSATKKINIDEKVNIIISPSLYWVKKVSLPVKYTREVKKLLPSLFEDVLPEGNYSYYAYKEGNDYIVFAYEDKQILDLLAEKGISPSNIANIYFAQSEFSSLDGAYTINNKQSLMIKDDILIVVPSEWTHNQASLNIAAIKPSKHSIQLQQFNHIIDKSSVYKIVFLLGFIILIIFGEWFITTQKIKAITAKKDAVFQKYHLKPTTMQNEAINTKLNTIYDKQTKLREFVSSLLKLPLSKDEHISYIEFDSKQLSVIIEGVSNANKILQALKKTGYHVKSKLKNSVLTLEVTL